MARLILESINIHSFKGKSFNIPFNEDNTVILGTNGSGKGIIAEALSWGLTGTPLYGDKNSLISLGDTFSSITLKFVFNEEHYVLTRELKKTPSGSSSTLRLNHVSTNNDTLETLFGISSKVLKSIMFPKTFLSLEKADKTKTLLGISNKTIYSPSKLQEVKIEEMSSVIKEYEEVVKGATNILDDANRKLKNQESMVPFFQKYDKDVAKNYFGHISSFTSAQASKIFEEFSSSGDVSILDELDILRAYSEIGSTQDLEDENTRLESVIGTTESTLESALEQLSELNQKYREVLEEIQNDLLHYGINMSIEEKKDGKVSVGSFLYKNLPIPALAGREQIEAGIAISKMFSQYTKICVPIFIENAESIVGEETLRCMLPAECQSVLEYVSDCPLAIGNDDGETAEVIETSNTIVRSKLWQIRKVNFVKEEDVL